jgi:hypothetical protein
MTKETTEFQICWNILVALAVLVLILDIAVWRP